MTPHYTDIHKSSLHAVEEFFGKEIDNLEGRGLLTLEQSKAFKSWHTFHELLEKIMDSSRFFQLARDENENIIGYFESKTHATETHIQVIQWTLVDASYRRSGIGSQFSKEFEKYCQENNVEKVITFIHEDNTASIRFREKTGFHQEGRDEKSGFLIFAKTIEKNPH